MPAATQTAKIINFFKLLLLTFILVIVIATHATLWQIELYNYEIIQFCQYIICDPIIHKMEKSGFVLQSFKDEMLEEGIFSARDRTLIKAFGICFLILPVFQYSFS